VEEKQNLAVQQSVRSSFLFEKFILIDPKANFKSARIVLELTQKLAFENNDFVLSKERFEHIQE